MKVELKKIPTKSNQKMVDVTVTWRGQVELAAFQSCLNDFYEYEDESDEYLITTTAKLVERLQNLPHGTVSDVLAEMNLPYDLDLVEMDLSIL